VDGWDEDMDGMEGTVENNTEIATGRANFFFVEGEEYIKKNWERGGGGSE
jgi:hypothetical protein